jgi:hypothetical protein
MNGLDDRSRDENGRIRKKRDDTRIDTLREVYGESFGDGIRGDARLGTLLDRVGACSLDDYLKRFRR